MAIDPYSLCPGGTGKKVKFCCPDLLNELEKIQKMVAADQRHACLDYIEQLEARYPNRSCLLTTKALLQGQLGDADAARQTVGKVLEAQPENPVALAEHALLAIDKQGALAAVEPLQRAIAASKEQMDYKVFEVIGVLAQSMLAEGYLAGALAHAGLQMRLNPKDELALRMMVELASSRSVPLFFKDIPAPFDEGPVDDALKDEFAAALDLARHFRWLDSAQAFGRLVERAPQAAAAWRNLGMLRAYLADEEGAAKALHQYAALDVPLDDAVEAEALAQLFNPATGEQVDLLFVDIPIKDFEQLQARLSSDRRADALSSQEFHWDEPDQPPPRASFWLLDRPMPATGAGLANEDVPESLAQVYLFGRETDREARIEMSAYRDQLDAAKALLAEIAGDAVGPPASEEVISSTPLVQRALSWNWRLPPDMRLEPIREFTLQRQRQAILEKWPKTPNPALDGKTPEQAAADPSLKIKTLAAIMVLEFTASVEGIDFNELRTRVGVGVPGEIDPTGLKLAALPMVRLHRLQLDKLSDDDLVSLYQRVMLAQDRPALKRICAEVVSRASLDGKVDKAQAYGVLASVTQDFEQALRYLHQARDVSKTAGKSCGPWDLEEFMMQLSRGNSSEAERLLRHIQTEHGREPAVMQRLMQVLYQAGVIDEHGRPRGQPSEEPSGLVVPGGSAEAAGKLWTPDAETGAEKKSGLWVPGMD